MTHSHMVFVCVCVDERLLHKVNSLDFQPGFRMRIRKSKKGKTIKIELEINQQ